MKTEILKLKQPEPKGFENIIKLLHRDGVMVYPTETFYGLGASCFSAAALRRIYHLKNRDPLKPLSVVASDLSMVKEIISPPPCLFDILAKEFWPGPLTLILPAAAHMPSELVGKDGNLGVRVPGHVWLRHFIAAAGFPISATSANISGEDDISDPADAVRLFQGKVDLIIDGGITPGGAPSTVVDLATASPRILREGIISAGSVKRFF